MAIEAGAGCSSEPVQMETDEVTLALLPGIRSPDLCFVQPAKRPVEDTTGEAGVQRAGGSKVPRCAPDDAAPTGEPSSGWTELQLSRLTGGIKVVLGVD